MPTTDQVPAAGSNTRPLSFTTGHIEALFVQRAAQYRIPGRAVVVNVSTADLTIENIVVPTGKHEQQASSPLRPWRSTLLQDGTVVAAEAMVVLRLVNPRNIGNVVITPGWRLYGETVPVDSPFPRDTPLWISPQEDLGMVSVDPFFFAGQADHPDSDHMEQLDLRVNLWYAAPFTDCFIHTGHPFLEVHTQVHGTGRMQKFRLMDERTVYEDVIMAPGWTHAPFFNVQPDRALAYPWHRYYADGDCIWMAIELHRSGDKVPGGLPLPEASPENHSGTT